MDSRWADTTDEEDAGFDAIIEPSEDAVAPQEVSDCTSDVEIVFGCAGDWVWLIRTAWLGLEVIGSVFWLYTA